MSWMGLLVVVTVDAAPYATDLDLEPLAEVERALLVVEVLHLPHPEFGGLLRGGEHFWHKILMISHRTSRGHNNSRILLCAWGGSCCYGIIDASDTVR